MREAYGGGRNNRGQLGDRATTNSAVPVAVTRSLPFQLIAEGGFSIGHTCGLTDLGVAYCWGANGAGQLGNNSNSLSTVPAQVFGQP